MAIGGNQMKIYSIKDKTELIEFQADQDDNFYTCDSSTANLRFVAGGKKGNLFYLQAKTD